MAWARCGATVVVTGYEEAAFAYLFAQIEPAADTDDSQMHVRDIILGNFANRHVYSQQ